MNIFEPEIIRELFKNYYLLFVLAVLLSVFLFTYYLIPKVLWVIKEKRLFKPVLGRSVHTSEIPSFGGIAFFMAFILSVSMLQSFYDKPTGDHLIAAVTILFMIGLKDDLVVSTPRVKLFGQLMATLFIVFSPEMQLTTLHGFMGIYEIPAAIGYFISAFIVVAMINAYNFIDGINGLAAIIGIIICTVFGLVFYQAGNPDFAMICVVVIGMLAAFLRYNLSLGTNKIFMGDSGSLVIGLILGVLAVKILGITDPNIAYYTSGAEINHRVWFVMAVLFIPVFDMIRVMILRIWNGRSPFNADSDHVHHRLLKMGWSHLQASLFLGGVNIAVILAYFLMDKLMGTPWVGICMLLMYITFFFSFELVSKYLLVRPEKMNKIEPERERKRYMGKDIL